MIQPQHCFRTRAHAGFKQAAVGLVLGATLVCAATGAMAGQLLITAQESALPTPPGSTPVSARGLPWNWSTG